MTALVAETAQIVDPQGENDDISLLAGLLAYALSHPRMFDGWDRESVIAAVRWNWRDSPEYAAEVIDRFEAWLV